MFDPTTLTPGQTVKTVSGSTLSFVAFVPQAQPMSRLVMLNDEGEIETYWGDGAYFNDRRPSVLDLIF